MHGHEASMFFKGSLLTHMAHLKRRGIPPPRSVRIDAVQMCRRGASIPTLTFSLLLTVATSPWVLNVKWRLRLRLRLLFLLRVPSCSQRRKCMSKSTVGEWRPSRRSAFKLS
jgi:hypothetical protein